MDSFELSRHNYRLSNSNDYKYFWLGISMIIGMGLANKYEPGSPSKFTEACAKSILSMGISSSIYYGGASVLIPFVVFAIVP